MLINVKMSTIDGILTFEQDKFVFIMLINVKMQSIDGILTLMSKINSCSAESSRKKSFITTGPYFGTDRIDK